MVHVLELFFLGVVIACVFSYNHKDYSWCMYEIHTVSLKWCDAKEVCQLRKKTLARIEGPTDHSFLGYLLRRSVSLLDGDKNLDQLFWIGLHQDYLGNRKWAAGEDYIGDHGYNPVGSIHSTGTNCFMLDSIDNSRFQSTNCGLERMFICKAKTLDTETCFKTASYAEGNMEISEILSADKEAYCKEGCTDFCLMYKYYQSKCSLYTKKDGEKLRPGSYVIKELLQTKISVSYGLNVASYDCFVSIDSSSSLASIYEKSVDPISSSMYLPPSHFESNDEFVDPSDMTVNPAKQSEITTPLIPTVRTFVVTSTESPLPFLAYNISHPKIPLSSSLQINVICNHCQNPTYVLIMQKDGSDKQEIIKQEISVFTISNIIMRPGEEWNFDIQAKPWSYGNLNANLTLYVNELPYNGVCDISPTSGIADTTTFRLNCSNWKDEGEKSQRSPQSDNDVGLSLELFGSTKSGEKLQPLLGPTAVTAQPTFTLTSSFDDDDYNVKLVVNVKDQIGDFESLSFTIKVYHSHLHLKTAQYLNWATENNDTMAVLEQGKQLISEWNNVALSNSNTGKIVSVHPKEWTSGVLDVDKNCNNTITFKQLLEDVLGRRNSKPREFVSKEIEKVSSVMIKNLQGTSINDVYDIVKAVDAFSAVVNDSTWITEKSVENVADALLIMSNILTGFVNNGSIADLRIFSSITKLTSSVVNGAIPKELPNWFSALITEDTRTARKYVDFMAFVYGTKAYQLIECSVITPEERAFVYKLLSKDIRLHFVQKQVSVGKFMNDVLRSQDEAFFKLSNSLCYGCNYRTENDVINAIIVKNSCIRLSGSSVELAGLSFTPTLDDNRKEIRMSIIVFEKNPWIMGKSITSSLISSSIAKVKFFDDIGNGVHAKSILIVFPVIGEASSVHNPKFVAGDASRCLYHSMIYRNVGDKICVKIDSLHSTKVTTYEVYVRYEKFPTYTTFDASSQLFRKNNWTSCLLPAFHFGIVNVCLRPILPTELQKQHNATEYALAPYNLTIITASCQVWDKDMEIWKSENDKCSMSWLAAQDKLQCVCKDANKELILGHSFYVPANTISFSTVFLRFSLHDQASVLGVLITIVVMYIVLCVWARIEDRKDLVKWGVTPLMDNNISDTQFYLITVYTGMRFGAGTNSSIQFEVVGTKGETGVRTLYDGVRKEFSRGSVMHFVMTTGHPLGDLDYIHIWFNPDNDSRPINPWYLNRIDVEDLQQKRRFVFGCNKWLPDESKSRCLEVVLPVYGKEDVLSFKNLFYFNVFENLTESHIFTSIFHRPICSNFTRVQRVTCLFVFVVMAMISNAIYFMPNDQYEDPEQMKLGPMILSLRTVYVSLIASAISAGSTLLITVLFRKSKIKCDDGTSSRQHFCCSWLSRVFERFFKESRELEKTLIAQGMVYTDGMVFPYWCSFVAWFLSIGGSMVSIFFLILFSMEWGKQKSDIWLTQFFMSFGENCIILDQIKVPIFAMIFAVIFVRLRSYRPSPLSRLQVLQTYKQRFEMHRERCHRRPGPLKSSYLNIKTTSALSNRPMFVTSLRKALLSSVFVLVVTVISYGNRDNRSFWIQDNIKNILINPPTTRKLKFDKITNISEFDRWIHEVALAAIFPEESYYNETLHWRWRQYFGDFHNFRVGPPRLRQLRVAAEDNSYSILGINQKFGSYDIQDEVTKDYCKGWRSLPCDLKDQMHSYSDMAWKYTSARDIWGLPTAGVYNLYGGGGYIAELDVNRNISQIVLSELTNNKWIDKQSRAVFLEFTLYSPNVNMFTFVVFLAELPETGGIITSYNLYPFRIYQHYGILGVVMIAFEVLFIVVLIILFIQIVLDFSKQAKSKYFSSVLNVLDFLTFIAGLIIIGLYIARLALAVETMDRFKQQPKEYMNFQHLVALDIAFVIALSTVQTLVTLRFIGNLGFVRSFQTLFYTLSVSIKDLFWFSVMFWYVLFGFACLGTFLFGNNYKSYKNILKSLETLTITTLGNTNFKQIVVTDPILGEIYFFAFIAMQVYILLTIFLVVLCESIDLARKKKSSEKQKLADVLQEMFRGVFKDKESLDNKMHPEKKTLITLLKELRTECHQAIKENPELFQQYTENTTAFK